MYKFNVYWTDKLKIDFLQRVILIHSFLYYETDNPLWSDKQYDEVAKQLTTLQNEHTSKWIETKTNYGYAFYDYDGSTGFDLFHRLNKQDKLTIETIASHLVRRFGHW